MIETIWHVLHSLWEILSHVLRVVHALTHPDTAFFSWKALGYSDLQIIAIILSLNTGFGVMQYIGSYFGFKWTSKTRRFSFLAKIKRHCTAFVCSLGYVGILIAFVPLPGTSAIAFAGGEILGLRYVLPTVLIIRIIRINISFWSCLQLFK